MSTDLRVPEVRNIRLGQDIRFDAWLYSILMDNNVAYGMNPDLIVSPEQLAFMVYLEPGQVYLPCSDDIFAMLRMERVPSRLRKLYNRAWRIIMRMVRSALPDRQERRRVFHFCRFRYRQYIKQHTLVPSRLVKRMTNLVLAQGNILDDPWCDRRRASSLRQQEMLQFPVLREHLDALPRDPLSGGIQNARRILNVAETARLLCLSAMSRDWLEKFPEKEEISSLMSQAERMCADLHAYLARPAGKSSTILFLCDADGGIVFDLIMIQHLIRMGHRVIVAVKDGFNFFAPTLEDMEDDPSITALLEGATLVRDPRLSKNDLLRLLREYRLVVISDGTRERLNLYRVSVTFSRAWKEADIILGKGWRNADILLGTSHMFTRDIVCYWKDERGFQLQFRPHAPEVRKFSDADISRQALAIISTMRAAKEAGRTVMFYSCIIGSIPGETATAIALVRTFVDSLREKMDNILIINPAEHFVEGMDGDDLMYMWEQVQRSGFIDVWRFQTFEDIEESFALMGRKVPSQWSGKDATFSTGCTKEMHIALDVQRKKKEMQIIGPDPRLFFRRGEYAVGKYFDSNITL